MLIVLRILFAAGLLYGFKKAFENAQAAPETGDLSNAMYLAYCVIMGIANAAVWAPYVGDKLSEPLTGSMTRSTYLERKNHLLKLVRWLDSRGFRRLAILCSFAEGIHRPDWPTAFFVGLKNARPGSWLEKVFAREVFRFDNFQHCMLAFEALRRHGIDPRPHHNPEVNLILASLNRQVRPEADKVPIPPAPPAAPLKRDRRVQLFERAEPPAGDPISGAPTSAEPVNDRSQTAPALASEPSPTTALETGVAGVSSFRHAPPPDTTMTYWNRIVGFLKGH